LARKKMKKRKRGRKEEGEGKRKNYYENEEGFFVAKLFLPLPVY
jgi:hypothetical protein